MRCLQQRINNRSAERIRVMPDILITENAKMRICNVTSCDLSYKEINRTSIQLRSRPSNYKTRNHDIA